MSVPLPAVGSAVNFRWKDRWITARVERQRGGLMLDLRADGIPYEATIAVGHGPGGWLRLDEMPLDWKQRHANDSEAAIEHTLVEGVIAELCANIDVPVDSLIGLGLLKIASVVAQVARAQALGFDPDLLRLTAEEANEEAVRRAAELVLAGVPVRMIDP